MLIPLGSAQTDCKEHQSRIFRTVAERNPSMVVTLPETPDEGQEAAEALTWAMHVCCEQSSWNKHFAHTWPRWSKTWSMPETPRLMHIEGSKVVDFDMCQFGCKDKGPMGMITNSTQIANTRSKRSPNRRRHHEVKPSTRNEDADMWTKGIRDVVTAEENEPQHAITYVQGGEYDSNVTGDELDKDKVEGAGKEEMKYFERMGDTRKYHTRRLSKGLESSGSTSPDGRYHGRLVAKQFIDGVDETVPPLETFEMLIVKFAAREQQRRDKVVNPEDDNCTVMIHVDVHRAYLYAHAKPETYVELPQEDQTGDARVRGYLIKAMYGTRQAASAWQHEVERAMCEINMNPGRASTCTLHRHEFDGTGLVHRDDIVIVTRRRHSKKV